MSHIEGKFVWFEQQSAGKLEDVAAFYCGLFGWEAEDMPGGGRPYKIFKNNGVPVGGATAGENPAWLSYASVSDVDGAANSVKKAGGDVVTAPFDVPTVGRMAIAQEPTGAPFALFRAESGDAEDVPAAHGDFHWNELLSAEPGASSAFFQKALKYDEETMEMPDGPYHVLKTGEAPRLGIASRAERATGSAFVQYVRVDDAVETLARAEKAGATRVTDLLSVPGVGQFCLVADPHGATIGIITPDAQS